MSLHRDAYAWRSMLKFILEAACMVDYMSCGYVSHRGSPNEMVSGRSPCEFQTSINRGIYPKMATETDHKSG